MNTPDTQYNSYTTTARRCLAPMTFRRMTLADIESVRSILAANYIGSRTCDFTIGGMFMWTDYFDYEMSVANDTLFVKGLNEMNLNQAAFSLPCGKLPLDVSLDMLRHYCRAMHMPCLLSAVPLNMLPAIESAANVIKVEELTDWADYLYDIATLASLEGKKMSKKRNHVNRFMADNPQWHFEPLSEANLTEVTHFFENQHLAADKSVTADFERLQVLEVLSHRQLFGFDGGVLYSAPGQIAAFTMGETIGDTLYVHIEKMDHEVAGAGETINKLFAANMLSLNPDLRFVNREEDTGDLGLRRAKESYHPTTLLRKFNVELR